MGRRASSRARAIGFRAPIALLALWSCASGPLVETERGFRHARHDYRVGLPPSAEPPWRRVRVEGSILAYGRPGPIRMTLSSRCGLPLTTPEVLARHLRIGIPAHTVREQGPVTAGDLSGWQQVFDVEGNGAVVRVKTVTFVVEPCVLDWTLSARGGRGFEAAERDFDAWWHTLRVDAMSEEAAAREGEGVSAHAASRDGTGAP